MRFSGMRIAVSVLLVAAAVLFFADRREGEALNLTLGVSGSEPEALALAQALSEVVHLHHPRLQLTVVETQGSQESVGLLESGRLDLAMVQAGTQSPPRVHLIAPLYPDAFQLVARQGSGITSFGDLRGRTVGLPFRQSGDYALFWLVASHYDLGEFDLRALPMSFSAAEWAFQAGALDAVFTAQPPGAEGIRRLVRLGNADIIPIEQAEAIRLQHPSVLSGVIPRGSYRGAPPLPETDLRTAEVQHILAGRADLDDRTVRTITSVMFQRRRDLIERSPIAGFIGAPQGGIGNLIPVHTGAQQFYDRERPSFIQENAEVMALVFSLLALGLSGVFRLANQRRRRRLEAYNTELLDLYREVRDVNDPVSLFQCKEDMLRVLVRVLDDAEEGKVTEEGFHTFSLTWEAVTDAIRDRLLLGRPGSDPSVRGPAGGSAARKEEE